MKKDDSQPRERIVLTADHAGFRLKEKLKKVLEKAGFDVVDEGIGSGVESSDYPDDTERAAVRISRGEVSRGIAICGTGIGASMAANKVPGVRAALALNPRFARLSREHNDANMLVLSGRFMSSAVAVRTLKTWLRTPFSGGVNHVRRIGKLGELDRKFLVLLLSLFVSAGSLTARDHLWQGRSLAELHRSGTVLIEGTAGRARLIVEYDRPSAEAPDTELYFDFDETSPKADRTGRYRVKSFRVTREREIFLRDSPTAGFLRAADRVVLSVPSGSLLAEETDMESFSVSFWIRPVFSSAPAVILERKTTVQAVPHGLTVLLAGRRIVFRFENMFFSAAGKARTLAVQSDPLDPGRDWFALSCDYDNLTGKILLTLDGHEQSVVWATESGGPESAPLTPRFTGRSDLVIGRNPFGFLDDLLVTKSRGAPGSLRGALRSRETGEIRTPVLEARFFDASLRRVAVNRQERPAHQESAAVYYRSSVEPFDADALKPDWSRYMPGVPVRGKYFQVRVDLPAVHPGLESLEIAVEERQDFEPPTGLDLRVEASGLRVRWRPVEDARIRGYLVTVRPEGGAAVRIDAGLASERLVTGLKDRQRYFVTVSSYDGSTPANESRPTAERGIFFTLQER